MALETLECLRSSKLASLPVVKVGPNRQDGRQVNPLVPATKVGPSSPPLVKEAKGGRRKWVGRLIQVEIKTGER